MKRLFVDTGAFVAKEIAGDQYHSVAACAWDEAGERSWHLYSSEHVFNEAMTLIARRTAYAWAAEWAEDALDSGIEWLRADIGEWRTALRLMRKHADQGVTFTDCLSFVLMKRERLGLCFGFDRHFEAAGFRLYPDG